MSRALIVVATDDDRQRALRWVGKAPWNTRIEFKAPKRSLPQNDRMWAMLTDVMMHMRQHGRDYTTDQWKAVFMHACGKEVSFLPSLDGKTFIPWGQSSSDLSKNEMTDLIEFMFAWGAENGVIFNEPADVSSIGGQGSDGHTPSPDAQTVAADPSGPGGPVAGDHGAPDGRSRSPAVNSYSKVRG
jgi:hypothetical protein